MSACRAAAVDNAQVHGLTCTPASASLNCQQLCMQVFLCPSPTRALIFWDEQLVLCKAPAGAGSRRLGAHAGHQQLRHAMSLQPVFLSEAGTHPKSQASYLVQRPSWCCVKRPSPGLQSQAGRQAAPGHEYHSNGMCDGRLGLASACSCTRRDTLPVTGACHSCQQRP